MRPVNNVAGGSVQRSRLLERLLNSRPNLNNGTVAGGLAYGVDQLTRGLNANRAIQAEQQQLQQETDAMNAMARGMSAQQWTPPDAEIAMGPSGTPKGDVMIPREAAMKNAAPAGGYDGAIYAAGQLGTPAGGRLTNQLLMGKMEQELAQKERDSELMQVYDPNAGGMVYKPRSEVGSGMMAAAPPARFETVNNPFGRGGVGQRNTLTGEISGYQAPEKREQPKVVGDPIMGQNGQMVQLMSDGSIRPVNLPEGFTPKPEVTGDPDKLRSEINNLSKSYMDARDAYGRVVASAKNPSPAGDLALVFNYMKVLDPGSVVREAEFANAAKAGTYGDRIANIVNRITSGQLLSPDQRNDFVERAGMLYGTQAKTYESVLNSYRGLATRTGLNPDNVFPDLTGGVRAPSLSGGGFPTGVQEVVQPADGGASLGTQANPLVPASAQDIETALPGTIMRTPKRGLVQKQPDGSWAPVQGSPDAASQLSGSRTSGIR